MGMTSGNWILLHCWFSFWRWVRVMSLCEFTHGAFGPSVGNTYVNKYVWVLFIYNILSELSVQEENWIQHIPSDVQLFKWMGIYYDPVSGHSLGEHFSLKCSTGTLDHLVSFLYLWKKKLRPGTQGHTDVTEVVPETHSLTPGFLTHGTELCPGHQHFLRINLI